MKVEPRQRIVQLGDWLPPEFSAVGQYCLDLSMEEAASGHQVTLVGLRTYDSADELIEVGSGSLNIISLRRPKYAKHNWLSRLAWSVVTNVSMIVRSWKDLRQADAIRFTGSPPFLVHFVYAANLILRKKLIYRITDFYPECIIAALDRRSVALEALRKLTNVIRRRIDAFEVIGEDMKRRLLECGVRADRMTLRRDGSPVAITDKTRPLDRPSVFPDKKLLLYSGNLGVAHDVDTFFEGYRAHHEEGSGAVVLWLNATGSGADQLARRLNEAGLPFYRGTPVPIEQLASLLITPEAHLVTLRTSFSGYVLPSKIYGCLASRKPILYVGPTTSDIHELCSRDARSYEQVNPGDAASVRGALEKLAGIQFLPHVAKGFPPP